MTTSRDPVALGICIAIFLVVTLMGFAAARWRRAATLATIDEWGLGGRQFGTWITWFLIGGDYYTAYTIIAVPALVYAVGAYGFFALPYTIIVYPLVFAVMPALWRKARLAGSVTAADVAYSQYGSRSLEIAIAVTGVIATMPFIALQLIGLAAAIGSLGVSGEAPLIVAFLVLALFTYSSGLRAPALIAFVKDIMICITVLAAVALIPGKLGGYRAVFTAADAAFKAKGSGGILLAPSQYVPYGSLALGSALAGFLFPHCLTGIFASSSANTIRKNAIMLPAYTLLLGLLAFLGYMGHAAHLQLRNPNELVPALFKAFFPNWFYAFAVAGIGVGALVPAAVMSIGAANLFTRNFWKAYVNPQITPSSEARVAKMASLAIKLGALAFILYLPTQFALDLQLLGGLCILQTFPTLIFGLYSEWLRAPALLMGWASGFFGGSWVAWSDGLKPLHTISIDGHGVSIYVGLLALAANIVVAVSVTAILRTANRWRSTRL